MARNSNTNPNSARAQKLEATPAGNAASAQNTQEEKRHLQFWRHKDVNKGKASFATGLNVYKVIWVFIIGCVVGVLFESLFSLFIKGEVRRNAGMLYGPFNQVYGIGAVIFTFLLYRFRKSNAFIIFLVSAVIGGIYEYIASWVQQIAFGSVSWEYSDLPTNIGGRTDLLIAIGWGLLGFIFIVHLWPFLSEMIERIPNKLIFKGKKSGNVLIVTGKTLTVVFAALLAINLALSGAAVYRAGRRAEGVKPATVVGEWIDATYPDEVMAEKFPSMFFVDRFGKDNSDLINEDL